jgi:hypothetical protein
MHEAVASLDKASAIWTKEDNHMHDRLKECPRCRKDLTAYLSGKAGQELTITSYSCPDCGPVKPGDKRETVSPAHKALFDAAMSADDAWSVELRRLFGKRAGDVRYTSQGSGAEGSVLRAVHDARQAAAHAYRVSCLRTS